MTGNPDAVDGLPDGVRQEQLHFATLLAEEARNLRDQAKRLRRSLDQQAQQSEGWAGKRALNVAGFITGTFLQQSPPSKEIVFFNAGLTYRF